MEYTVDSDQLLNISTVMRLLDELRETYDPINKSDLFTEAQILLTELLLGLKPLLRDQSNPVRPEMVSIN